MLISLFLCLPLSLLSPIYFIIHLTLYSCHTLHYFLLYLSLLLTNGKFSLSSPIFKLSNSLQFSQYIFLFYPLQDVLNLSSISSIFDLFSFALAFFSFLLFHLQRFSFTSFNSNLLLLSSISRCFLFSLSGKCC